MAYKRKRITFKVSVLVDKKNQYRLFGSPAYICCRDAKGCFIDNVAMILDYANKNPKTLTKGAMRIRRRIRDAIKVEMLE